MKSYEYKSKIANIIKDYLTLKNNMGIKAESSINVLINLDKFLYRKNYDLNNNSFEEYINSKNKNANNTRLNIMRIIRQLCIFNSQFSLDCFIPDSHQFPRYKRSTIQYIFSIQEIKQLINLSEQKIENIRKNEKHYNAHIAFILLYTTGLRIGELANLKVKDINFNENTISIINSKFGKSRILPLPKAQINEIKLHISYNRNIRKYSDENDPLIISCNYKGIKKYTTVGLYKLLKPYFIELGIETKEGKYPRIHDFRHTFAVHALIRWYENDENVQAKLPLLSAYMGHASYESTEYYLKFIEDLSSAANRRYENACSYIIGNK
jgi:integrase/recombinase XerD